MRIRNLILPVAASAALLAGCATQTPSSQPTTPAPAYNGVQDLDADAIWQAAADALADAQSFHLKGSAKTDAGQSVEIDAVYAGDLAEGSYTLSGLELEFIIAEDGGYVRAAENFWREMLPADQADLLIPLLGNRYLKLPSSTASELILEPETFFPEAKGLNKGDITEYQGQPAIVLTDDAGGKIYIALVGEPYPLALTSSEGNLEFLDVDAAVTIEAPPADQVFDATAFTG
jgi:hypothetical protein